MRLGNRSVTNRALRDFYAWRQLPANDAAYLRVVTAFEGAAAVADDPDMLRATDAALRRQHGLAAALRSPRILIPTALAAVVVVVAGAMVMSGLDPTYATRPGEQRLVVLADGSRMRLNTDSRARVHLRGGERTIRLSRGEAFFDVAHDPAHPFVVQAGGAKVRAIGTRFDVRRDPTAVKVTLVEGVVRVQRGGEPQTWTLAPNQQLDLPRSGPASPRPTDAATATAWTAGRLIFHETTLAAAVAEVNRYGRHRIELDPSVPADRRIDGVFDVGDTEAFVSAVSGYLDLSAARDPDGVIRLRPAAAG
jgi:transmembrane sensor